MVRGGHGVLVLSLIAVWVQTQGATASCVANACLNDGKCIATTDYPFPEASSECPAGFPVFKGDKCYKVVWRHMSREDASKECKNLNAGWTLMTEDERSTVQEQLGKLLRHNHAANEMLWTTDGRPIKQEVTTDSSLGLPVCVAKASKDRGGSQCQCKKPYIGPNCAKIEADNDHPDMVICKVNGTIYCHKNHNLFIDYATYEPLDKDQPPGVCTTHDVRHAKQATGAEYCSGFKESTRAIVRQLCQGRSKCTLTPFLQSNHCRDVSEKDVLFLKIRYRCVLRDEFACNPNTGADVKHICTTHDCVSRLLGDKTWWEAMEECRILGGQLAFWPFDKIDPEFEPILTSWIKNTPSESHYKVWIGEVVTDKQSTPAPLIGKCSYLQIDEDNITVGMLPDLECAVNKEHFILCNIQTTDNGTCPGNSTIIPDPNGNIACYSLVMEKSMYGEAEEICRRKDGKLATYYSDNAEQKRTFLTVLRLQSSDYIHYHGLWVAGRGDFRDSQGKLEACAHVTLSDGQLSYRTPDDCNFGMKKDAVCAFPRVLISSLITPSTKPPPPTTTPRPTKNCPASGEWPPTEGGKTAEKPCAGKLAYGSVTWKCNLDGKFDGLPNYRNCSSINKEKLQEKLNNISDPIKAAPEYLLNEMKTKTVYSQDLSTVLDLMDGLLEKQQQKLNDLKHETEEKRTEVIEEIGNSMGAVLDEMLTKENTGAWTNSTDDDRSEAANKLLEKTDNVGFMLADALQNGTHEVSKDNFNMKMSKRPVSYYGKRGLQFPEKPNQNATVMLPEGFAKKESAQAQNLDGEADVKTVFVSYNDLSSVLSASTFNSDSRPNSDNETAFEVNSKVMGASLGSLNSTTYFDASKESLVIIELRHLKRPAAGNASCVFWNTKSRNWDVDGCNVKDTNETHTVCECNHLTNFAVLMDVHNTLETIDEAHKKILTWITYIGCSISIVCLSLSCIIFIAFRSLWSLRTAIHCNLCASLLAAQVILLGGLDQTDNQIVCSIIAGFLHFAWLSGFMWMALEGVQIYILLIKVFDTGEQKTWLYYLAGYGIPAAIIAVSAGVHPSGYGTKQYCWLSREEGFIFSFAAPMATIFLFNMVMLIMALRAAASVKMQRQQSKTQSARLWIRRAASLIPLLGVTWIFGFLYVNESSVVFAYIFAISNSLQGVFIFVYHCLRNEKVQQVVGRFINRKREKFDSSSASKSRSNSCSGTSQARTLMTDDGSTSSGHSSLFQAQSPVYTIHGAANVPKTKGNASNVVLEETLQAMNKWRQKMDVTSRTTVSPVTNGHSFVPPDDRRPREVPYSVGKPTKQSKIPKTKGIRVRKVSEMTV